MNKKSFKPNYFPSAIQVFGVAFEMGFIIALPIVILAKLGKHLDVKYGKHYFLYLGIVLAILSSVAWAYGRFQDMIKRLNEATKLKDNKSINSKDKE